MSVLSCPSLRFVLIKYADSAPASSACGQNSELVGPHGWGFWMTQFPADNWLPRPHVAWPPQLLWVMRRSNRTILVEFACWICRLDLRSPASRTWFCKMTASIRFPHCTQRRVSAWGLSGLSARKIPLAHEEALTADAGSCRNLLVGLK